MWLHWQLRVVRALIKHVRTDVVARQAMLVIQPPIAVMMTVSAVIMVVMDVVHIQQTAKAVQED